MIVQCPHCQEFIWIEQLNCRIFRHATFKKDQDKIGEQVPPHASQSECEAWVKEGLVYGCAKPFQILESGEVVVCDYI
jgi:hypothetical protein